MIYQAGYAELFQGTSSQRDRDGSWVRAMEGRPVVSEVRLSGVEDFAGNQTDEMRTSMEKRQ